MTHSLVNALRDVPSFASVDERILLAMIGDSANLYWPAGRVVFERGSQADGLYIVISGGVRVVGDNGSTVAVLGPGDFFGELSLLLGTAHQHGVYVDEAAESMVVPKETFDELMTSNPELGRHIRRKAEERMTASAQRSAPPS